MLSARFHGYSGVRRAAGTGCEGGQMQRTVRLLCAVMVFLGSMGVVMGGMGVFFQSSPAFADGSVPCVAGSTEPADPGAGFCANYNGDTTWYGTYGNAGNPLPSTDGFGLCADPPASGGDFPDPNYDYVSGSAPTGAAGDENALGFALSEAAAEGWWGGSPGQFTSDQAGAAAKLLYDSVAWKSPVPSLDPGVEAALAQLEGWYNEANGVSRGMPTLTVSELPSGASFVGSATFQAQLLFASGGGVPGQNLTLTVSGGMFNSPTGPTTIGVATDASGVADFPVYATNSTPSPVTITASTTVGSPGMDFYHPTARELSAQVLAGFVAPAPLTTPATFTSLGAPAIATGTVSVQKSGNDSAYYGVGGAVFQVLSGSAVVATLTTWSTGATPESSALPVGSYVVHESVPPTGYASASDQAVTVTANQNTLVSLTGTSAEQILPATLTLHKSDARSGVPLAGAVFAVAFDSANDGTYDEYVGTCTTDGTGTCVAGGNDGPTSLLPGNYEVKEVTAPSGYYLDPSTSTQDVTLTPGESGSVHFSDFQLGSLELNKTGDDTAYTAVTGAVFSVTGPAPSASAVGTLTIGAGGLSPTMSGLAPGTYTVTETEAPPGYQAIGPVQVAVADGAAVTSLNVVDHVIPATLSLEKVDKATNSPLAGAEFNVMYDMTNDGSYQQEIGTCVTTASGSCAPVGNDGATSFLPGNYQITEVAAPAGYDLDESTATQSVTLKPGEAGEVTFSDALLVSASFQKAATGNVNSAEVSLAGAVIEVLSGSPNGTVVTSCTTDASGACTTPTLLQSGLTYCWSETAAPIGLAGNANGCFTAGNGQAAEAITVTDAGEFVSIAVKKVDATNSAVTLSGAVFDLYRVDGRTGPGITPVAPSDAATESGDTWVARSTTGPDGIATFPLQFPGYAYCAVEQQAPANYTLTAGATCTSVLAGAVTVPPATTTLTIVDSPAMVTLQAHKFNSVTPDTGIPGAVYDLYVEGSGPPSTPTASNDANEVSSSVVPVTGDSWYARGTTNQQGDLSFTVPAGYAWCFLEHSAPLNYVPDPALHCSDVLTAANDVVQSNNTPSSTVALPETLGTVYISARKYNSATPNTVIQGATYELLVEGPMPTGYASGGPSPAGPTDFIPAGDHYWGEGTTNAQGMLTFSVPAGYAWCLHELAAPPDYLPDPALHCTEVLTNLVPGSATSIALPEVAKPAGALAFTGGPTLWLPVSGLLLMVGGGGLLLLRRRLEA